jgi:DNA-binding MarR family transcriptional regulator
MFDFDVTFAKLTNPRMNVGLMVLHSLLERIQGDPVEPRKLRDQVDDFSKKQKRKRPLSKQSITNAARRLEEAGMIDRDENKYSVKHGHLLSVLLDTVITLNERVSELEEQVSLLKSN